MTQPLMLNLDLLRLLHDESLVSFLQPLVSAKRKAVFGMEALVRGVLPEASLLLPPGLLFSLARDFETRLALDRLCRKKAFEAFAPIYKEHRHLLLSINVDASIISSSTLHSGHVLNLSKRFGVPPGNVIIEIIESRAADTHSLFEFVKEYKKRGFLIALDDIGAGHSNLDRIPAIKPHIIKIDRSLVKGIHEHFHQREITRSLVRMAGKIGAMALGEGVECIPEVVTLMEMGVDIFQGYYFGYPEPASKHPINVLEPVNAVGTAFKAHTVEKINARKQQSKRDRSLAKAICEQLARTPIELIDQALSELIIRSSYLECLYILNMEGVQISSTICNPEKLAKAVQLLYEPACKGADHSLKEYFLPLKAGLSCYTTESYISMATGNSCITVSTAYKDSTGNKLILCADIHRNSL
jgi:EAL domain-containing protein (putative c-di-GMP-specific phosphodiesterase class I)